LVLDAELRDTLNSLYFGIWVLSVKRKNYTCSFGFLMQRTARGPKLRNLVSIILLFHLVTKMTSKIQFTLFSAELRLIIWHLIYDLQMPRLVEVQTAPHENCNSHRGFCPRFSPSPSPIIVNICQESRRVAFEIATTSNHLFFSTPSSPPIFFNPEIDTLYVPDEKSTWIRGPDGILTQLKAELGPNSIRVLAADLNPYGMQEGSMKADMKEFVGLREYILVVPELTEGDIERFKAAERALERLKLREEHRIELAGGTTIMRREYPERLKFAIKRGGSLRYVEEGST
jgi:2EXR family